LELSFENNKLTVEESPNPHKRVLFGGKDTSDE